MRESGKMTILLAALTLLAGPRDAFSADFDYPELQVTPRASERLAREAERERGSRWATHVPVQVSALTTLAAGVLQMGDKSPTKDPDGRAALTGILVGGSWIAATSLLAIYYTPYVDAQQDVGALPAKSQREQLAKERLAEEAVDSAARLGRRLKWLSFATNAGASVYMLSNAVPRSLSAAAAGVSIATSLAPLLFRYRWEITAQDQREYKKRIYAPVAASGTLVDFNTGKASPGLALSFVF